MEYKCMLSFIHEYMHLYSMHEIMIACYATQPIEMVNDITKDERISGAIPWRTDLYVGAAACREQEMASRAG